MKKTTEKADIKNAAATFPYPEILGLGTECQKASAVGLEAWKRHVHTMLHAVDAIEQGSVKTRETQLGAAIEAHLTTVELENAVAGAKTPLDAVDEGFARMCEFSRQLLVAGGGATAVQFHTTTGRSKH